jgi:hypothetical protein
MRVASFTPHEEIPFIQLLRSSPLPPRAQRLAAFQQGAAQAIGRGVREDPWEAQLVLLTLI